MLYQIVLSIALLILAFTTLPKLAADTDPPSAREQTIEPGEQGPSFRPMEQDKPKALDIRVIDPSLNEIARWLSENFELPYAGEAPQVERVPSAQLYRLRYKALLPLKSQAIGGEHSTPLPEYRREVVAVYDDSSRTIYLPDRWTGATVAEQSVIVHEMVHHLQNVAGLKYECGGAREKPAYLAQAEWLKRHGLELEKEFEVDMFTVVALSGCMN
jgi:hypothetical protein